MQRTVSPTAEAAPIVEAPLTAEGLPDAPGSGVPRVAYTIEQSWHRVPGGTAVAALRVAEELRRGRLADVRFVSAFHRHPPAAAFAVPGQVRRLPLPRNALYESWLRWRRPPVERATGPVDIAHATAIVPCATRAPLVVTVHDIAFVHEPERFTGRGVDVMTRSLQVIRDEAAAVITSSQASADDLRAAGIDDARLHVVTLGVDATPATAHDVQRVRAKLALPERFVLFVGTLEPRKNLARLAAAVRAVGELPLVVAGPDGWGAPAPISTDPDERAPATAGAKPTGRGQPPAMGGDVRFVGFVDHHDLPALYAAATVFAYPSEREGFGLPVAEAMAQGTPVVTSAGRSTEEVAGGAAVLVDPLDVDAIAGGLLDAIARADDLATAGRRRAAELTWATTARATAAVYRAVAR